MAEKQRSVNIMNNEYAGTYAPLRLTNRFMFNIYVGVHLSMISCLFLSSVPCELSESGLTGLRSPT